MIYLQIHRYRYSLILYDFYTEQLWVTTYMNRVIIYVKVVSLSLEL